nr:uncharacterized protein LOC127318038 isoform X2 [Lolium perenne]
MEGPPYRLLLSSSPHIGALLHRGYCSHVGARWLWLAGALDRRGEPGHGFRLGRGTRLRRGRGRAAVVAAAPGLAHPAPHPQRQDRRRGMAQPRGRRPGHGGGGGRCRAAAPSAGHARGDDPGGVLGQSQRATRDPHRSGSSTAPAPSSTVLYRPHPHRNLLQLQIDRRRGSALRRRRGGEFGRRWRRDAVLPAARRCGFQPC